MLVIYIILLRNWLSIMLLNALQGDHINILLTVRQVF